jgi:hypothetical protein
MEFHFRFGFQGETSNLHGMDVEQGVVILGSRRHSDTGEIRDGVKFLSNSNEFYPRNKTRAHHNTKIIAGQHECNTLPFEFMISIKNFKCSSNPNFRV